MEAKVIAKTDIGAWLKPLADKYEIVAPVEEDGVTLFKAVEDPSSLTIDCPTPATGTLREHFTPKTEVLFEYEVSGQDAELKPAELETRDRLIFGARACDAAALRYVDKVYSINEPRDEPYFSRREHTAIVGVFCNKPSWSCFCTEVNDFLTNPVEMDVYLTDIGEKVYAEAFTPKGEELIGGEMFQTAADSDTTAMDEVRQKALSRLPKRADHETACLDYDWNHPAFLKLAEKCLGCGACAFLCPTCHCFDIQECAHGKKGTRYRCWDTCQFEKFTLMGAGHNPRPSKQERTRQRAFHKFTYSKQRYGILGCVGCGRCIAACPVNIDIRDVVKELETNKT